MAAVDTTANQWATKAIQTQPNAVTAPTNVFNQVAQANAATAPNAAQTVASAAPNASLATANNAANSVWNVDANQTTSGQLDQILKANNPLMQTAATQARQAANERGLINSSMAVQAGQQAMINSALPIAQQNAQTHATSAQANAASSNATNQFNAQQNNAIGQFNAQQQNTTNQFNTQQRNDIAQANTAATNNVNQFNAQQQNTVGQFNTQQQNAAGQFNTQQQNAMGQFNSAEANKLLQTSLDLNNRTELANIEANYKNLMQANASAFQTWQQTLKNISDIQQNADMDAGTKQAAVNEQTSLLKNSFNMLGAMNNLNLSSLLTF